MKFLGEQQALERLSDFKEALRKEIAREYEHRAKSCLTCETQGACCLDSHFVNVHISRLEAKTIARFLRSLPDVRRAGINKRIDTAIERFGLSAGGDSYAKTYSCPMFEKGTGCLIHHAGKPVPCILHACYENKADLPPDELQSSGEKHIEDLNVRTYGRVQPLLPLPLAIRRCGLNSTPQNISENESRQ